MPFISEDIHVFIFTHNRSKLLEQTLQSVAAQTVQGMRLTVLDNLSTDNTEEVVRQFAGLKPTYVKTTTPHPTANFIKAQELMDRQFALILHDDDLLHPYWIETVLSALNKYPDTALIPSRMHAFYGYEMPSAFFDSQKITPAFYRLTTPAQKAGISWLPGSMVWSGSVARSKAYKQLDIPALFTTYGKILDGIVIQKLSEPGPTLVSVEDNVFYRFHAEQDSQCQANGISCEQFLHWIEFFHKQLAQATSKTERSLYTLYSFKMIHAMYHFLSPQEKERCPWDTVFVPELLKKGLLSPQSIFYAKRTQGLWGRIITLPMKLRYDRKFYHENIIRL